MEYKASCNELIAENQKLTDKIVSLSNTPKSKTKKGNNTPVISGVQDST